MGCWTIHGCYRSPRHVRFDCFPLRYCVFCGGCVGLENQITNSTSRPVVAGRWPYPDAGHVAGSLFGRRLQRQVQSLAQVRRKVTGEDIGVETMLTCRRRLPGWIQSRNQAKPRSKWRIR
jgi:hypothetical protein